MQVLKNILFFVSASIFFCSAYAWICTEVANRGAVMFGDYGFSNCQTNQLSPAIVEGDILGVIRHDSYTAGDIVIFSKLGQSYMDRITGINHGQLSFSSTAIYAKNNSTASIITAADVTGEVVSVIPYLGFILSYIQTFPGWSILLGIMFLTSYNLGEKEE